MIDMRSFKRGWVAAAVIGLLVLATPTAFAGGNGAFTDTQVFHDVTDSFPTDSMCGSPAGTITVTYSGVLHATVTSAGDVRLTANLEGDFILVPDDITIPTFAGHFVTVVGVGDHGNGSVQQSVFSALGTATDGSGATLDIHGVAHVSVSASGQVNLVVDCH